MNSGIQTYLDPTPTVDSDHPAVIAFGKQARLGCSDPRQQAVRLYYAVRDGIRYDPYSIEMSVEGLRASTTLARGRGWCVAKAILLAACCRAAGIPARLGFADVRNHLTTQRMREMMQTDVFYWHGYTAIHLDGRWVKATPAFNVELCERFRQKPLDFDGRNDSVYHPFDLDGQKHMEYLRYRGEFADAPIARMIDTFSRRYSIESDEQADFDRDVARETGG